MDLKFTPVDLEPETLENLQTETAEKANIGLVEPLPGSERSPEPEPKPEPKKGRGRPRKNPVSAEAEKSEAKPEPKPEAKAKKSLTEALDEYTEKTAPAPLAGNPEPEQPVYKNLITGYMLILVIDTAFPYLSLMILKRSNPKWNFIRVEEIKMSATEKKELEPIADEVAKMVFNNVNPILGFFIVSGVMYISKIAAMGGIAEARAQAKKNKTKGKK